LDKKSEAAGEEGNPANQEQGRYEEEDIVEVRLHTTEVLKESPTMTVAEGVEESKQQEHRESLEEGVQSIMDLHWTLSTNGTSCTFWVYTSEPLKMV